MPPGHRSCAADPLPLYPDRTLRSPTALVHAIAYVLGNAAHHFGQRGADPYASRAPDAQNVLAAPRSWLLREGWRRARKKRPH